MKFEYRPKGVCSRLMQFEVEDDKIVSLSVIGGCDGNLKGISSLIKGMPVQEVIDRLEGVRCNGKPTSCPDQIACALKAYQAENA